MNAEYILQIISRNRGKLLIAGVLIVVTLVLGVIGVGFAVYKASALATEKAKELQPVAGEVLKQLPERTVGVVEGVVLSFATVWLQQAGGLQDVANVKLGLACFDAIGGPSPKQIVTYAQSSLGGGEVSDGLRKLANELDGSAAEHGPNACVTWLLNG